MKTYFKGRAEEYKNIIKELDKVYSKVVKNFPDIKKKEIRLEYRAPNLYAEFGIINSVEYFGRDRLVKDPSITVGSMFFEVNESEREAIIVHELGHYKKYKKYSVNKIGKRIRMTQEVDAYRMTETGTTPNHRMGRMIKCLTMHELYADQEAVKAGYGKPLLSFLEVVFKRYEEKLSRIQKEELKLRIKNLEDKLRQGEES